MLYLSGLTDSSTYGGNVFPSDFRCAVWQAGHKQSREKKVSPPTGKTIMGTFIKGLQG